MSSSTPSSSSTASASISQSFNVKPLSLSPTSTSPFTPVSQPPSISRKTRPPSINISTRRSTVAARRQSSISYIVSPPSTCTSTPQTCGIEWLDNHSFTEPPPSQLSRSISLGSRNVLKGEIKRAPRSGLGLTHTSVSDLPDELPPNRPRPSLTPVEKHADLLHVIAQKESICLELRSQLAIHEAELLQLKRKWEIIVSRGLDVPVPIDRSSTYTSSSPQNAGTAVVLEGIKEGVQGVGRLILGQAPASPSPNPRSSKPRPRNERQRYSSVFDPPTSRLSQSSTLSTSSTASSSSGAPTSSTNRTSLSSCGSIDVESETTVVSQDTGATPVMCPGPVSKPFSKHAVENKTEKVGVSIDDTDYQCVHASSSPSVSAKTLRRRSGGVVASAGSSLLLPATDDVCTSPQWQSGHSETPKSTKSGKTTSPPPSSISGLGSLAGVGFGKKWEEGFVKSQKRASLFLSDIVSALSAPTPTTPSFPSPGGPSTFNPVKLPLSNHTPSPSLLDDSDDDTISAQVIGGDIMVPEKCQPSATPNINSGLTLCRKSSRKSPSNAKAALLDDDEWNW